MAAENKTQPPSTVTSTDNTGTAVEHTECVSLEHDVDEKTTIWQLLFANPKVVAYFVAANAGSLLFGYDLIANSAITTLPAFQSTYGDLVGEAYILPALWQGLWTSFVQLGIMMGALASGFIQDKFGRKIAFVIGGVTSALGGCIYVTDLRAGVIANTIIATILVYLSPMLNTLQGRRLLLFFGKIILGVSMGVLISTCQTYISEISPPKLRGLLLGFFAFTTSLAQMIGITILFNRILIFNITAFQMPFALQWVWAGLAIVAGFIIPESPSYLVSRGRLDSARKSHGNLYSSKSDARAAINRLVATMEEESLHDAISQAATYTECFTGTNRRRTLIIIFVNLLQQLIGISLIANATYFLIMAGMSSDQSLRISQIGIDLSMMMTCVSWFTMATLGRRFIILASCGGITTMFLAMGIAGLFPTIPRPSRKHPFLLAVISYTYHHILTHSSRFIGVALLLVGLTNGLGVGSAYPVVASEVSSVRLRSRSSGIGFISNSLSSWLFNFTVPYMFNADESNLGGKIGFVFAAFSIIGFVGSWLFVPETKTKTFAEIDHLFECKTPTRAFKKPIPEVSRQTKVDEA